MKLRPILFLLSAILALSCGNDDDADNIIPGSITYTFRNFSEVVVEEIEESINASIGIGTKTVFIYHFISDNDQDIGDDEYSDFIIFEIDSDATSFTFSNEELLNQKMYFTRYCFCFPNASWPISSGTVQGTKQSNGNWNVAMDVIFNYGTIEMSKSFNETFVLE